MLFPPAVGWPDVVQESYWRGARQSESRRRYEPTSSRTIPRQLVKYVDGQKYEPHFDYGEACDFEENLRNGHRHVTMLVYLNDIPDEHGGHTVFPKLELKLSPKARAAITFNDCLPNGQEDPRTLHGGSPPSNGTKIAINIWIRAQPFSRGLY